MSNYKTKIVTNRHERQFVYRYDVPASVLANELDWTTEEEHLDGYFCYRGIWYHLGQFMHCYNTTQGAWHGCLHDSAFSGVLIKLSEDCETYQVATFYQLSN
mgnify:CR=1 FL=1